MSPQTENFICKVKKFFHLLPEDKVCRNDQQHVMSEEELLDQTIDDSFPASDPPGHISKSQEDKLHH